MQIETKFCSNGTYIIELYSVKRKKIHIHSRNTSKTDFMIKIVEIIKNFANGEEMFFGHYRLDGINLTVDEWNQYSREIPEYFKSFGRYESITETVVKKNGKIKTYSGHLITSSSPINASTFEIIPKVFHYYLETTCFCPKINWKIFTESYQNYMKDGVKDYIMSDYTNFLFSYSDSGKFSISFNPNINNPDIVYKRIVKIISKK